MSDTHSQMIALRLVLKGTPSWVRQCRRYAPSSLLDSSHREKRGLEPEKQAAANRTNGVVGRTGRIIPTIPIPRLINPKTISSIFIVPGTRIPSEGEKYTNLSPYFDNSNYY